MKAKYDCPECYEQVYRLMSEYGAFRVLDAIKVWAFNKSPEFLDLEQKQRISALTQLLRLNIDKLDFDTSIR
jgi:hypothetical protein